MEQEPIGVDLYNQAITGRVSKTLSNETTDSDHIPCIVLCEAYQHHGYRESDTFGTLTAGQNQGIRGDTPLLVQEVKSEK